MGPNTVSRHKTTPNRRPVPAEAVLAGAAVERLTPVARAIEEVMN
jgi:hypothetical protein